MRRQEEKSRKGAPPAQNCFENHHEHYDGNWQFGVVPWWAGTHYIVMAYNSSDSNDPFVYCDPWRDETWADPIRPWWWDPDPIWYWF